MKIQRDGKEYTLTAEEVMEAHEEFVTSFMVAELENSYDVPHKYSKDLAKEAYDMYADSSIYSEYDCMKNLPQKPFLFMMCVNLGIFPGIWKMLSEDIYSNFPKMKYQTSQKL